MRGILHGRRTVRQVDNHEPDDSRAVPLTGDCHRSYHALGKEESSHFLTIRDLRQARARLFVRGLMTKAESDRIAKRIEKLTRQG